MKRATKNGQTMSIRPEQVERQNGTSQKLVQIDPCAEAEVRRKDDFISMASHELKTPITTLKGHIDLALVSTDENLTVPRKEMVQMAHQVDRLTRVISDLIELSRIQKGEARFDSTIVNVDQLLNQVVDEVKERISTHQFHVHGASGCQLMGDHARLRQAFIELFSNAVKFSPQADSVDVTISCNDAEIDILVVDQGIGIAADKHETVFDRYYRVLDDPKQPFPGLGVGLFMVEEIVHVHHGSIIISSELGMGTAVGITLPITGNYEKQKES